MNYDDYKNIGSGDQGGVDTAVPTQKEELTVTEDEQDILHDSHVIDNNSFVKFARDAGGMGGLFMAAAPSTNAIGAATTFAGRAGEALTLGSQKVVAKITQAYGRFLLGDVGKSFHEVMAEQPGNILGGVKSKAAQEFISDEITTIGDMINAVSFAWGKKVTQMEADSKLFTEEMGQKHPAATELADGAGSVIASVGLFMLSGGSAIAAASAFAASGAAEGYLSSLEVGKSEIAAIGRGLAYGVAEGGPEALGLQAFTKIFGPQLKGFAAKNLHSALIASGGINAFQEAVTGEAELATDVAFGMKPNTAETWINGQVEVAHQAAIGAVTGLSAGTALALNNRRVMTANFIELGLDPAVAVRITDKMITDQINETTTTVKDALGLSDEQVQAAHETLAIVRRNMAGTRQDIESLAGVVPAEQVVYSDKKVNAAVFHADELAGMRQPVPVAPVKPVMDVAAESSGVVEQAFNKRVRWIDGRIDALTKKLTEQQEVITDQIGEQPNTAQMDSDIAKENGLTTDDVARVRDNFTNDMLADGAELIDGTIVPPDVVGQIMAVPQPIVSQQSEKIQAQLDELAAEKADLAKKKTAGAFITLGDKGTVEVQVSKIQNLENDIALAQVNGFEKGYRKGRIQTLDEVRRVKSYVMAAVNKSGLSAKDKNALKTKFGGILTSDQLMKRMDDIRSAIRYMSDMNARAAVREGIVKLLDRASSAEARPKVFSEDTNLQKLFNDLRTMVKGGGEYSEADVDFKNPMSVLMWDVSRVMSDDNATLTDTKRTFDTLAAIYSQGRTELKYRVDVRNTVRANIATIVGAELGIKEKALPGHIAPEVVKKTETMRQKLARMFPRALMQMPIFNMFVRIDAQFQRLFAELGVKPDSVSAQLVDPMMPMANYSHIEHAGKEYLRAAAHEAYGVRNPAEMHTMMKDMAKPFVELEYDSGNGLKFDKLTKGQALYIYATSLSRRGMDILANNNKYTETAFATLDANMSDKDRLFVKALMRNFGPSFHKLLDDTTQYVLNRPTGLEENYFPRAIDGEADNVDMKEYLLFQSKGYQVTVDETGRVLSRVPMHDKPLQLRDFISEYRRYTGDVGHWVAYKEHLENLSAALDNKDVRLKMEEVMGKSAVQMVDDYRKDLARGRLDIRDQSAERIRGNMAAFYLPFKPLSGLRQIPQLFLYSGYIDDMKQGIKDMAYAADPKNWAEIRSVFGNTSFMKERGAITDADSALIEQAMKADTKLAKAYAEFSEKTKLNEATFLFLKLGDRTAIYGGEWAVYQQEMRKSGNKEKAIAKAENVSRMTQQDSSLAMLTPFARQTGVIPRILATYSSGPLAGWTEYTKAWVRAAYGESGKFDAKKFARMATVFHIVIPTLMYAITAAAKREWDNDEWAANMLAGAAGQLPLVGTAVQMAGLMAIKSVHAALGEDIDMQKAWRSAARSAAQNRDLLSSTISSAYLAVSELLKAGKTMDISDMGSAVHEFLKVSAPVTGVAGGVADRLLDQPRGLARAIDGDMLGGVMQMLFGTQPKKVEQKFNWQ